MKKLLTLFTVLFVSVSVAFAADYTVGNGGTTYSNQCNQIPFSIGSGMGSSFTQQLYLASELTAAGASSGKITAISFIYKGNGSNSSISTPTRSIEVWIRPVSISSFSSNFGYGKSNSDKTAGSLYFSGSIILTTTIDAVNTITLDTPFSWDGTSNIIITINDKTETQASGFARYHKTFSASNRAMYAAKSTGTYDASLAYDIATTRVSYVPVIKFTFADALPTPSTPSDLTVSATTANSASLAWSSVSGATSYDLQQSNNGSDWSELASGETGTSFEWTGLEAGSTHYVRIRANNASGNSEWSDAVSFTTDAVHTHDGITFDKWNSTNDIPLSGNYYLAADITISGVGLKDISGSLNLCLNGHTISFTQSSGGIQINNSASLTIFDNIGGGFITSPNGTATIQVNSGGRLTLHGGSIRNSASNPPVRLSDDTSILSLDMTDGAANEELLALANGHKTNVHINRSFTSASYNTICLPFELKNSDLESVFGSGYSLASLSNSTFDGSTIELEFSTSSTTLNAGKPYLIQPAHDVSAPTFNNVTVSAASLSPVTTEFVDFIGVFSPTVVGSGENILFLSENNELKWNSNASGALKGFRAYFEVKGAAQAAVRARIVQQAESTEAVINTSAGTKSQKVIRDGQLYLMFEGRMYNVQGQRIQ